MYVYEPHWEDPHRELEMCMNFYRHLIEDLYFWDLMEFVNYLSARDGIEWALEELGGENVDPATLAEIEGLDATLRAHTDYLVNELELYKHIWRFEPEEYWWWYLDGGKPDGPLETREAAGDVWETVAVAAVPVVAEQRTPYEAQPKAEQNNE